MVAFSARQLRFDTFSAQYQSSVHVAEVILHGHWDFRVAGHSLGGAMATMAAIDIAKELRLTNISVVTFGAPRTGNRAFAREYEQHVPDTWHIINAKVGQPPAALKLWLQA